jgi:hypothetical protein
MHTEAEVSIVPMHVEEDGVVVVVATTDSKADQGDGIVPVMADFIVVVIEVDIVEDEKSIVVVTEVVITKVSEVVEEATVAVGEVVTSCTKS